MKKYRGQFSVCAMCRVLKVSSSGFYDWLGREESARSRSNRILLLEIKAVHKKSFRRYGSPRVYHQLRKNDRVACSLNRVAKLMSINGIEAIGKRRFKSTTDSDHGKPVADNILDRQFDVECTDAAWCADLTYIWTGEGWLYLAIILDLFSRRILGWSAKRTMARSIVLEALDSALQLRRPPHGLVHHSDRGSQYASDDYQKTLLAAGVTCSMSRKGNCWDNAPAESFFATLKKELIHQRHFRTRAEAKSAIFEFIESWYNRERLHSSLGYMSPVEFEAINNQPSTTMAA